ncbi:hypothetical protein PTSG_02780 [Salpingoeca rosetta]|uniref:Aminotransferase class V domain-containing protein n=1 Tax=Salpingoeca rosetta (strain ATCC 50818 / BSB-021) TaxID=946362 RepID=F2U3A6_SALR5|nr:uncharacterized protein PTSG_02780 [Salpingoeca rosetta]EGD82100.1 hypothetical protein PTSG_02780 [Salpingoeca rosetta]|eukprot:XP_004996283.1 hypothetical protein PTSG_02780 [Salpingoeca rosetta]
MIFVGRYSKCSAMHTALEGEQPQTINDIACLCCLALCCLADHHHLIHSSQHTHTHIHHTRRRPSVIMAPTAEEVKAELLLEPGYVNLNHGSFGTVPKVVMDKHVKYLQRQEQRPDVWFRGQYQEIVAKSRSGLASFLDAPLESVCLVENTSTGVNACLRATCVREDDRVLLLGCAYPMVKNTTRALQRQGLCGDVVSVPVAFPISAQEEVTSAVEQELQKHPKGHFKVAIFSHIVSFPAMTLPVAELTRIAKDHGVSRVVIDGAHVPGHLPISVASLFDAGVDAYIGNCHKWLFCPKGTAVLCLAPGYQVYPTVVSSEWHLYQDDADDGTQGEAHGTTARQYVYTGTRDYTAMCCISDGIAFHTRLGGGDLMQRNLDLAQWGRERLVELFGTEAACPADMQPCMFTVRLPSDDADKAANLYAHMMEQHNTAVAVQMVDGKAWLRLSAQAYVTRSDIDTCAQHVLQYYAQ